jgi:hypothetical protein
MTILLLFSFLLLGGGIFLIWIALPEMGAVNTPRNDLVAEDAKIAQTIVYTKCGHEVSRRTDVFPEWVGMDKERVLESAAENWRILSFEPSLIEAACIEDLFCAQHWVLALNEDGAPGVYHNQYGFSMVKYGDVALGKLEEETRESLARGIAFDSREELQQWVAHFKGSAEKVEHQNMTVE